MRKEEKRAQGLGIALLGTFRAFSLRDNRLGAIKAVTFLAPVLKSFELVAAASARRPARASCGAGLTLLLHVREHHLLAFRCHCPLSFLKRRTLRHSLGEDFRHLVACLRHNPHRVDDLARARG